MQDNKNLILAIVLCLIILFGWVHVTEYMGWVAKRQAGEAGLDLASVTAELLPLLAGRGSKAPRAPRPQGAATSEHKAPWPA